MKLLKIKRKANMIVVSLVLSSGILFSCEKSPEAAAEEVCECMDEKMEAMSSGEDMGDVNECTDMAKEYTESFESEDREVFIKNMGDCAMGHLNL